MINRLVPTYKEIIRDKELFNRIKLDRKRIRRKQGGCNTCKKYLNCETRQNLSESIINAELTGTLIDIVIIRCLEYEEDDLQVTYLENIPE